MQQGSAREPHTPEPASSRRSRLSGGGGISRSTLPMQTPPKSKRRKSKSDLSAFTPAEVAEMNARSIRVRSSIRNILLSSPLFPRFYADMVLRYAPNSNEANILRPHYQKIREKVNDIMSQKETCTHIKVTGVRCGSPALKGEQFCYFHQNAHRGVRRPKQTRLHPIALIEDEESIQYALMEVMNALMRNTIDLKRAALILRALHIAVKNASRVKFNERAKDMVTQVPTYEMPTEEHEALAEEADLPAVAANPNLHIGPEGPHYWEQQSHAARLKAREDAQRFAIEAQAREDGRKRFAEERAQESKARAEWRAAAAAATASGSEDATTRVGTDAFVRPASPERSRGASASAPEAGILTTSDPSKMPSHNFKNQLQKANPANESTPTRTKAETSPQRKPPASATPAPKERKNAAQSLP